MLTVCDYTTPCELLCHTLSLLFTIYHVVSILLSTRDPLKIKLPQIPFQTKSSSTLLFLLFQRGSTDSIINLTPFGSFVSERDRRMSLPSIPWRASQKNGLFCLSSPSRGGTRGTEGLSTQKRESRPRGMCASRC